nr:hypothetical protein [uncultured Rhodopila sp.]
MTPLEAIERAKSEGFDPRLQQVVLTAGEPELAYRFAQVVPEADLEALEAVVLESGDLRIIYDFALLKSERGGGIDLLQERVLSGGDGGLMILFANDVEGADVDRFEEAIQALPDRKYALLFDAEQRQKGKE